MAAGIVDTFTGAIGWATGGIWDKVKDLVRATTDWISTWINHVIDWASAAVDGLWGAVRAAGDFANTIVTWAVGMLDSLQDRIVDWAGGLIQRARDFASGLVDQLGDWAESAIGEVWGFANGFFDWALRNIWDPLWNRITGVFDWVTDNVMPWVLDQLSALGGWAADQFRWVWDRVEDKVRELLDWLAPYIDVIQGAWDWLVWVARHPYNWFVAQWRELGHLSPDTIADVVTGSLRKESHHLENLVMDWFD